MSRIGKDSSGGEEFEVLFKKGDHLLIGNNTAAMSGFAEQGAEPGRSGALQAADLHGSGILKELVREFVHR